MNAKKPPENWENIQHAGIPAYCSCQPTKSLWEPPVAHSKSIPPRMQTTIRQAHIAGIIVTVALFSAALLIPPDATLKTLAVAATLALAFLLLKPEKGEIKTTIFWPEENPEYSPIPEDLILQLSMLAHDEETLTHPTLVIPTGNSWEKMEMISKSGKVIHRIKNPNPEKPTVAHILFQGRFLATIET